MELDLRLLNLFSRLLNFPNSSKEAVWESAWKAQQKDKVILNLYENLCGIYIVNFLQILRN